MEAKSQEKQSLPVMCPRCTVGTPRPGQECELCGGKKFFYWDSKSLLGARTDGTLIRLDTHALTEELITEEPSIGEDGLTTDDLLSFFALWAAEDSKRKFKLWFQERWYCSAWENRYARSPFRGSGDDVHSCVRECYQKLLKARGIR